MLEKITSITHYKPQSLDTLKYFCAGPSNILRKSVNLMVNSIYYSYKFAKKLRDKSIDKNVHCIEKINNLHFSKEYSVKSIKDNFSIISNIFLSTLLKENKNYNAGFSYPESYLAFCEDVEIIGGTRIIKKGDSIFHDEVYRFRSSDYGIKAWNNLKIDSNTYKAILTNVIKKSENNIHEGILISCDHDNNYFHWMVESLPMLIYSIENIKLYKNHNILIPKDLHPNYKEALLQILNIYKINNKIIELNSNEIYHIDKLVIPSDFSRILDRYYGDLDKQNDIVLNPIYIQKIRNVLKNNTINYTKRKLYLTRRSGTYRKLLNEKEIEIYLLNNGFEIVDLSNVSFKYQQVLFSQAEIVIAPTGATMTNMILAPENCIFIVLFSDHILTEEHYLNGKKIGLWDQLAEICDINLYQINGKRAGNREDVHDDFTVSIEKIKDLLKTYRD